MRGVKVGAGLVACLGLFGTTACASSSPGPGGGGTATTSPSAQAPRLADLPAAEILQRARAADARATSFTMTFAFTPTGGDPGQPPLSGRVSWDHGGHCVGRIALRDHGSAELIASGGTTWLKPDAAYARAEFGPAAATVLAGKYLKGPNGDPHFADIEFTTPDGTAGGLCDYGVSLLTIPAEADELAQKLGTTTIRGVHVVKVQPVGKGSSLAFIASEGTPYLIQTGEQPGVGFSDYGKPVAVTLPPDSQTVAVTALPHR